MSLRVDYNQNYNQSITTTLSERLSSISTGGTYQFVFTNEQTGQVFRKNLTDISVYPVRYNQFYLTTSLTITGSTNVPFPVSGWYKYQVYETSDTLETFELEMGKCYVYEPVPTKVVATEQTNMTPSTKKVYKKS